MILDAQGDPNAVFIFQIGSTLITGSNTTVQLINGAQACNVFWQVGSSATLGTGTRFVGTVMADETITANTAATIHGRLLARTAAVNLDTNTITQSNCAIGATETATPRRNGRAGSNDDWRRHDDRWHDGYDTDRHVTDARERRSGAPRPRRLLRRHRDRRSASRRRPPTVPPCGARAEPRDGAGLAGRRRSGARRHGRRVRTVRGSFTG